MAGRTLAIDDQTNELAGGASGCGPLEGFVADERFALAIVSFIEADGKVELNSDKQAAFVAFFQPFPNTSNFSTLVGGSDPC